MLTTLPLRTLLAIAHNQVEPPAGFIAVNWHAGIETLDNLRTEWADTPATFTDAELDEEVPIITEAVALDEAATILAERLDAETWDTTDTFIEDPERRGCYEFWRTWSEIDGRGIAVAVYQPVRDADGDEIDTMTVWSGEVTEFEKPGVNLKQLRDIVARLANLRDEEARLVAARDDMIRELRPQGLSLRVIAGLAGISHMQVKNICAN